MKITIAGTGYVGLSADIAHYLVHKPLNLRAKLNKAVALFKLSL